MTGMSARTVRRAPDREVGGRGCALVPQPPSCLGESWGPQAQAQRPFCSRAALSLNAFLAVYWLPSSKGK